MNRLMSRLFGTFILAAMLIFITGTAYSQTDTTTNHKMYKNQNSMYQKAKYDKDVSDAASVLRTKVNLTMEQTRRVEGILQDYKNNSSKSGMSASKDQTMDKIQEVLTSDQKTKFDNVKSQWWSETQKKLTSSSGTAGYNSHSKADTTNWNK